MSKIQEIQPKYVTRGFSTGNINRAAKQGFGQAPVKPLTKNQEYLIDQALTKDYLGKKGKFLDFLSRTAGEIQNIWIMNIGTAFVAPLFIANNPISHDDKKTKQYAAWRQPISAVIALAFGLGINIPIPNYIESKVAEGRLEKFDLRAKPPEVYLKSRYNHIKKHFNNLKGVDKKYFDMINDGKITNSKEFTDRFPTPQIFTEHVHRATLKNAAKEILDNNNSKSLQNTTLREFLIKNLKFEEDFVDKTRLNTDATDSQLSKIKAMDFLREFGYTSDEVNEKSLRTFVNNNLYKNDVKFNPKERKYITRVGETFVTEEAKNTEKITMKHLFKVLGIDENLGSNKKLLDTKMDKFLIWLDKNMNIEASVRSAKPGRRSPVSTKIKSSSELLQKRAENIIKNLAERASKNYGGYKKIQGIALSLAMLPFSCGLLNWAYPRIMEKYFPHLSKTPGKVEDKKGGK